MAQTDFGPKGVGGFLGYVDPEHVGGTIGFGAVVDMGTVVPLLGVDLEALYWSKSEGPAGDENTWRDLVLAVHLKYRLPVSSASLKPYVGGGIGPHFYKHESERTGRSDTDTKFGLHLLAGAEYQVAPRVTAFGDWRYALVSDINQFAIFAGAKFKLGP